MMKFNILARILVSFGLVLLALLSVGLFAHSRLAVVKSHALALKGDAVMGMYEGSLIRDALSIDYMEAIDGAKADGRATTGAKLAQLVDDYDKTVSPMMIVRPLPVSRPIWPYINPPAPSCNWTVPIWRRATRPPFPTWAPSFS
jgi:hypothetical protein